MSNAVIAQVIKSSNDVISNLRVDWSFPNNTLTPIYLDAPAISDMIYCAGPSSSRKRMAVAWDDTVVPKNKIIRNVTLHLYTAHGHSKPIYYRYANFNEGSAIPSYEPSSGSKSGGIGTGWGTIDLGVPDGNSVVMGAELVAKDIIYYPPSPYPPATVGITEYWSAYSHRAASNRPYVVITYDDVPPGQPKSLYPSGIMLSTRNIIRFAWLHNSDDNLLQKSFTLQYSLDGSTWTTVSQTTPNQYYDLPANTLPNTGTVIWRVKTKDTNDAESEYASASFTLGIPPQKAPMPVYPISQYVENNKTIKFEWVFIGGSDGETQSKYELQYSINNGTSWTTLTESTNRNYKEIPPNTLPTGNVIWRVRTYNEWNEVSPYSDARSFTVIGSPATPLITTITNTAKPVISWQSTNQHIYEMQIFIDDVLILDSGKIPSISDKSFKVPVYLNDGQYRARLRIANEYNLFSEWAEKNFTISTVKPPKPGIEIFNERYGVIISSFSEYEAFVYRDGIEIGKLTENRFYDYSCQSNKEHRYFIRVVHEDIFNDSDIAIGICEFYGSTLALASTPDQFIKLRHSLNKELTERNTSTVTGTLQYYDGRKSPIIEYGEFGGKSKSLSFFVGTLEEIEALEEMLEKREVFLLRGKRNLYGVILSLEYENNTFGYEIAFAIEQAEWGG